MTAFDPLRAHISERGTVRLRNDTERHSGQLEAELGRRRTLNGSPYCFHLAPYRRSPRSVKERHPPGLTNARLDRPSTVCRHRSLEAARLPLTEQPVSSNPSRFPPLEAKIARANVRLPPMAAVERVGYRERARRGVGGTTCWRDIRPRASARRRLRQPLKRKRRWWVITGSNCGPAD